MIDKILNEIKNQKITPTGWMLSFVGILFVRFILESISSPTSTGVIPSDPYTLVHYLLFFICLTMGTILIVGKLIKNYSHSIKVVLFGLPLLWLAPIADILISKGMGYKMLYIFDSGKNLIFDLFTFFGPSLTKGATYGIRLGLLISILGLGYFIWLETKKVKSATIGILLIYILVFFGATLPGVIYSVMHPNKPTTNSVEIINYLKDSIFNSTISYNTLHDGKNSVSESRFLELTFDKFMSQILFILSFFFGIILFWKYDNKKFWSVMKNIRLERINFYIASLFCGVGFAYINKLGSPFVWVDVLGFICLIISWVALWMNAVHVNDIVDLKIDEISNRDRPLVKKDVDVESMREIGIIWLIVALLGSWSAGYYPFFMSLVYIASSYIYSVPPLRLRRFPLVPSFLIGIACLATILSGFFFVSTYKAVSVFPTLLAIGIVIMVTLAINFKDIKDIEGDRANGIITLPILFGNNGIKIVALLFSLSILLAPFFLSFWALYILAIPASIIGYKIVTKKPYNEKPIFILRFFYMAGIGIFYLISYLIVYIYKLN